MTSTLRRAGLLLLTMMVAMFSVVGVAAAQEPSCYPVPPGGCETAPVSCADILAAIAEEATVTDDNADLDTNGDGVIDAADVPADCGCADLIEGIAAGTITAEDLPEGALADCGCDELIAAIAAGTITAADLPEGALADCGCEELIAAVAAGTIDAADLPEGALADCGCEELIAAVAAGTIDAADLPEGALDACGCEELQAAVDAGTLDASLIPDTCDEDETLSEEDGPDDAVLADTGIEGGPLALLALSGLLGGMLLVAAAGKRA